MSVDMSSAFGQMWQFLSQRFLLFFQWIDQITIGGVSLLKIGIGLTVLTIVIAVVLPIIRTSPVSAGLGSGGMRSDTADQGVTTLGGRHFNSRQEWFDYMQNKYGGAP